MAGPVQYTRKSFVLAGLAMAGMLIVGVILVAVYYSGNNAPMGDTNTPITAVVDPVTGQTVPPAAERPSSIPRPNTGKGPQDAGDPGGWEQLTLFGLLAAGMLFIGGMIFVGGRKARRNRAEWMAAAAPGQEALRTAEHDAEILEYERTHA
jgi:hypothetical protein